jgi:hypothetical protein
MYGSGRHLIVSSIQEENLNIRNVRMNTIGSTQIAGHSPGKRL